MPRQTRRCGQGFLGPDPRAWGRLRPVRQFAFGSPACVSLFGFHPLYLTMNGTKRKINIVTLGCSKNVVDSEELMSQLRHNGLELTSDPGETDTAIINTCGFIEAAKQKYIDSIIHSIELKTT